jgi:DNA polymerase V
LRGRSLITEDGEAIEGEALDDVTVIGVVTFTICDVRRDNAVV